MTLGDVEKEESNHSTHKNGCKSSFKTGGVYSSCYPGTLWFQIELFELHIYKYVDIKMCKSNIFFLYIYKESGVP